MLPLIAAQGGLRLRAEAHAVLARAQLTAAAPEDGVAAETCAALFYHANSDDVS